MSDFWYTEGKEELLKGTFDLVNADIRAVPCMTNTTADTEEDVATVTDFTTLDELDDSGYSSGGISLSNQAVNKDATNDRGEFDADDIADPAYNGDASRDIAGLLIIQWTGSLGASIPIAWIDSGGFPVSASSFNGVQWDSEGILQVT